ncbi:unnamed protein product, partial [Effrenium voratum]
EPEERWCCQCLFFHRHMRDMEVVVEPAERGLPEPEIRRGPLLLAAAWETKGDTKGTEGYLETTLLLGFWLSWRTLHW